MDRNAILQRTGAGCETIMTKSVKLTQSERLVLIIVDGVSTIEELRKKVWVMAGDRFARAVNTLLDKELIFEVLLPMPGQERQTIAREVAKRFLQQDPLDPVTIISVDPEDEFGNDMARALGLAAAPSDKPAAGASAAMPANAAAPDKVSPMQAKPAPQRIARPPLAPATVSRRPEAPSASAARTAIAGTPATVAQGKNANAAPLRETGKKPQKWTLPEDVHYPDNWPENLFDDEEDPPSARPAASPHFIRRAGSAALVLIMCGGVLVLAYFIARSLLRIAQPIV